MIELNTGRNALVYLVKSKKIKKIYLPYFLCDSVSNVLDNYSIDYEYYHIDKKFLPLFDKKLNDSEYLYVVNYYGQVCDIIIKNLKEIFCNIIIDNTQSFFQKPIEGIDTIYSCRKYFGVPDGAYLFTDDDILTQELEEDKSKERMIHILGRYEGQAYDYYKNFRKSDESLKELPLKRMSNLTKNILGAIDYERVIELRNQNFRYLYDRLKATNILGIRIPNGAFAYPYYIKNGIEIRKKLAEKKIYIPTLWPSVLIKYDEKSVECDYAANILPLPCDQRYKVDDMKHIVEMINKLMQNQGGKI
jgi:hypothetical protein